MTIPFFSIIIPVFNKAAYLQKTLESINAQTFSNYEVICVDDCSTDSSREIVKRFGELDPRLILIEQDLNQGVSVARNRGIQEARGEWLLFIDADDYISFDSLEILEKEIKSHESLDVLLFNGRFVDESGNVSGEFFPKNLIFDVPEHNIFSILDSDSVLHYVNAAVSCVRRDFLVEHSVCFHKGIRHEDWEFMWHLFAFNPRMVYIPEFLYFYVKALDGYTSSKQTLRQSLDLFKVFYISKNHFSNGGLWNDLEFSAILVAIRHFWDFLTLKVSNSNDRDFKIEYATQFRQFLLEMPSVFFEAIVTSHNCMASPKVLRELRDAKDSKRLYWIVQKTSSRSRFCSQQVRSRVKFFMTPLINTARWIVQPLFIVKYLIFYIKNQLSN